jgi:Tol biopolymer transport system component/DNA-binding winged helix-turn-helix (wHTH) protein
LVGCDSQVVDMGSTEQNGMLRFGEFELNPARRVLRRSASGEAVPLTPRVFDSLLCLIEHRGEVVEKRTLLETVWPNVIVEENNLTQAISALRRALGEQPQQNLYVATVPGRGYRFVADVSVIHDRADGARKASSLPVIGRRTLLAGVAGGTLGAAWLVSRLGSRSNALYPGSDPFSIHSEVFLPTGNHTEPTLSPEGSRVAFVSDADGGQKIFVKVIGGGDPRPVTSGEFRVSSPNWSPRNNEIIFMQFDANGLPREIRSVDPQGTGTSRPVIEFAQNASFSDDGATIVFEREQEIWLAAADGSNARRIEGIPTRSWVREWARPALSPGGASIAFYHQETGPYGDIWVIPAAGGEARQLTRHRAPMGRPVWAPDGRHIYFSARLHPGGAVNIWRIAAGGGEAEAVTNGPGGACRFPAISADGSRLVYQSTRTSTRFKLTDPETRETVELASNGSFSYFPSVSRDGTRFAFFSEVDPRERIFVQNIDGTGLRQVTDTDAELAHIKPGWGADDAFLYFYEEFGDGGLMRVPLGGAPPTRFVADVIHGETQAATLSPTGDRLAYVRIEPSTGQLEGVVIRELASGGEHMLDRLILDWPSWSRSGNEILGTSREGIALCNLTSGLCRLIHAGRDLIPAFSRDESRIFFTQPIPARRGMRELWVMGRDGSDPEPLFEIGPIRDIDGPFQVAAGDRILWNEYRQGDSEIWMATAAG